MNIEHLSDLIYTLEDFIDGAGRSMDGYIARKLILSLEDTRRHCLFNGTEPYKGVEE